MIYSLAMPFFTTHTIILLPHARHHLERWGIPLAEVLETLNNPERKEGLATDMFTVERAFPSYTLYVDYYLIRPLQEEPGRELLAIIDWVDASTKDSHRSLYPSPQTTHWRSTPRCIQPC